MFSEALTVFFHHLGHFTHYFNNNVSSVMPTIDFFSAVASIVVSDSPTGMLLLTEFKLLTKLFIITTFSESYRNDHLASLTIFFDILAMCVSLIKHIEEDYKNSMEHKVKTCDDEEEGDYIITMKHRYTGQKIELDDW